VADHQGRRHQGGVKEPAAAADVSIPTIKRLQAQDGPLGGRDEIGSKIRVALETAGVEVIDENGGGPVYASANAIR
jgi:hypothetical protein